MAKTCVNHKDQPSVTMCHQCHRPICKSCTMVTPHGSFCSSECSILFREYKEKMKISGERRSGGMALKIVLVLILLVVGMLGVHMAARRGTPLVKSFDFIGFLLEKVELPGR